MIFKFVSLIFDGSDAFPDAVSVRVTAFVRRVGTVVVRLAFVDWNFGTFLNGNLVYKKETHKKYVILTKLIPCTLFFSKFSLGAKL